MARGLRVGVRRVQRRRARADGAVHAQVAGVARAAERDGRVDGAELAPVADHLGQRRPRGQGRGDREVLGRADVRRAELVDHADAVPGGVLERPQDRVLARGRRQQPEQPLAGQVVRVARDEPAGVVPLGVHHLGAGVEEGGADHGGVHVDAAQVDRAAVRGPVDLLAGERPLLGPDGLVPALAQDDRGGGGAGVRREGVERLVQAGDPGEVHADRGEPGLGQVRVGVHEGRGDQPAVELDDPVRVVGEVHRGVVVPRPDDRAVLDAEGGGVRVGGRVDVATAEQDASHLPILTAGARTGRAPPRARAAGTSRSRRARGRSRCRPASSRRPRGPRRRGPRR